MAQFHGFDSITTWRVCPTVPASSARAAAAGDPSPASAPLSAPPYSTPRSHYYSEMVENTLHHMAGSPPHAKTLR